MLRPNASCLTAQPGSIPHFAKTPPYYLHIRLDCLLLNLYCLTSVQGLFHFPLIPFYQLIAVTCDRAPECFIEFIFWHCLLRFYFTKDCFFQSAWSGPDCLRLFYFWSARLSSWTNQDDRRLTVFDRRLFFNVFKNSWPFSQKCGRSTKKRIWYFWDQNNPWWNSRLTFCLLLFYHQGKSALTYARGRLHAKCKIWQAWEET